MNSWGVATKDISYLLANLNGTSTAAWKSIENKCGIYYTIEVLKLNLGED
jgi:hypothetical protein